MLRIEVADEAGTQAVAAELARVVSSGLVTLQGPLGAGKTSLCRAWLRALGHSGSVRSPTYTLVEPYFEDAAVPVFHLDLYRLGDAEELEYLGVRDYLAGASLCLVEWPERGQDVLPSADLSIEIVPTEVGRRLVLRAGGARTERQLEQLAVRLRPHFKVCETEGGRG
ncbi:MAG: tRNA (adenosine(37)-N6)-threonylcarbamoyltransferase complex ATPase subunit type 1 TsaE [Pseudomonadota bacterium]|nr:tRNA (adenosine(37)-N6)-threonylcarbamoyltransferase complex ATPase subunit type 1 TsaE [Pseudomonadota bacterium]